ncbi:hypothetical protein ISF_07263 [Cordyceps fumosorosea ARSEF 2679]|uniref:Uncharacterized protein n=1 Tax=Cordyceps fumosorosea (strain ARSEF 2679) TaxID=1081104 RepID=A0A167PKC4_CORFA|nr:hypothetical protein ISF_07263 [Cordyceps fumosorosea ARSEF 2679]OAA56747.1 hypothetical protein ISF_07263 [Cordyceps fumosorosea ARSEF 2679]
MAFMRYLCLIVADKWVDEWDAVFTPQFLLPDEPAAKAVCFACQVASVVRDHGGISIARIESRLHSKGIIKDDTEITDKMLLHHLVFSTIGWLSTLYISADLASAVELSILRRCTGTGKHASVAIDMVSRPLDELLRAFGDLVPLPAVNGLALNAAAG